MTELAKSSQLDRVNLYRMLSEKGNPRLSSLTALLDALSLEIKVVKSGKCTAVRTNCSKANEIACSRVGPDEAIAAPAAAIKFDKIPTAARTDASASANFIAMRVLQAVGE